MFGLNRKRDWRQSRIWLAVAFCCVWPGRPLVAQDFQGGESDPARLCLVLVTDTSDPQIGESVQVDQERLRDLFSSHVPSSRLQIQELSGKAISQKAILNAIRTARVRPQKDILVLYFCGHGGFDTTNRDHLVKAGADETYRSDLRKEMQARHPRLTVILTDTCSTMIRRPPRVGAIPGPGGLSRAFKSLFFDPQGLVDISCTSPGAEAMGDLTGGFFTTVFCEYLNKNSGSSLSWSRLVKAINANLPNQYSDARQTAYALSNLPDGSGSSGTMPGAAPGGASPGQAAPGSPSGSGSRRVRFGVSVTPTSRSSRHGGVEVTQVIPGLPGTRMRSAEDGEIRQLVAGMHVITHINGQEIHSYEDFSRAVKNSPQQMKVRVYNLQTGTHRAYETTLQD